MSVLAANVLKNNIFRNPMYTSDDLKDNIQQQCEQINTDMLVTVFKIMRRRINVCIHGNVQHIQQFL